MTVTVLPDDAEGPGHAVIRVPGAAGTVECAFRIFRDPDWAEPNLGPNGWQGSETLLTPDGVRRDGADLLLLVGPAVCDRLEEGMFFFALPAPGITTALMWPDIEAVHAGSGGLFDGAAVAPPAPAAVSRPSPPDAAHSPAQQATSAHGHDPGPTPVTPAGRPRWPWLLAAILVLAAAAGGGAWWWFNRPVFTAASVEAPPPDIPPPVTAPPATPPPVTAPPAPPVAPPVPPLPDLDAMSVRDLVARNKPSDMVDQAVKRLATRPGDALLLLETAGEDRHDGAALTMLARLYDPNKPRQGGIGADPRQAAKDYREAERNGDHSGAADRDALRRSLATARDNGDAAAKLIEGDFWP